MRRAAVRADPQFARGGRRVWRWWLFVRRRPEGRKPPLLRLFERERNGAVICPVVWGTRERTRGRHFFGAAVGRVERLERCGRGRGAREPARGVVAAVERSRGRDDRAGAAEPPRAEHGARDAELARRDHEEVASRDDVPHTDRASYPRGTTGLDVSPLDVSPRRLRNLMLRSLQANRTTIPLS